MDRKKRIVFVGVRMPETLKELIEIHISRDTHQNISEFIREAIRQKLQKEAPQLYARLFEEDKNRGAPS